MHRTIICARRGFTLYMEFEDSLVSELETQEGLARDVHDNVQKVNI